MPSLVWALGEYNAMSAVRPVPHIPAQGFLKLRCGARKLIVEDHHLGKCLFYQCLELTDFTGANIRFYMGAIELLGCSPTTSRPEVSDNKASSLSESPMEGRILLIKVHDKEGSFRGRWVG